MRSYGRNYPAADIKGDLSPSSTLVEEDIFDKCEGFGTVGDNPTTKEEEATSSGVRIVNVAGDHLTGPQIAKAFGRAQKSPCKHVNNRELTNMARESFPDLYEQIRYLQTSKERTNIGKLRREFPGLITSFGEFLEETHWGERERVFEDLSDPESLRL